jgi:sulfur carrier protein ThiS
MAIEVQWFATLAKRSKSRQEKTTVDWSEGLTPLDVFVAEGFRDADIEHVMVLINEEQAEADTVLQDGDRLEFLVSIQGG